MFTSAASPGFRKSPSPVALTGANASLSLYRDTYDDIESRCAAEVDGDLGRCLGRARLCHPQRTSFCSVFFPWLTSITRVGVIRALAELVLHLMLRATKQLPPEEEEAGGSLDTEQPLEQPLQQGASSEDPSETAGRHRGVSGSRLLLPPPILPGNWAPAGSGCFLRDALKGVVAESKGFEAMEAATGTEAEAGTEGRGQRRGGSRAAWGLTASMAKEEEAFTKLVFGLEAVLPQVVDVLPQVAAGQQVSALARCAGDPSRITHTRAGCPPISMPAVMLQVLRVSSIAALVYRARGKVKVSVSCSGGEAALLIALMYKQ